MKIKNMSLSEIKKILSLEREFSDIKKWKFTHIPLGEMYHTYKLSKGKKIYFVKELKEHEAQMEYFLSKLKLRHLPCSLYPGLLKQKILVRKFIVGGMLQSKNMDLGLLKDFAVMRNTLNDKKFFDANNFFGLKNYDQKDDGFYEKSLKNGFAYAPRVLKKLDKYHLKEVDNYWKILKHINKDKKNIILDYVKMPFAKQHQDFREDNIIIAKKGGQMLIDWGSSYGYHPFMFDPAPFLVNNKKALKVYTDKLDVCKNATQKQIMRWLYVGLAAKFLDNIKWRLHPSEYRANTKAKCKKYLAYEYKTFKYLLENN